MTGGNIVPGAEPAGMPRRDVPGPEPAGTPREDVLGGLPYVEAHEEAKRAEVCDEIDRRKIKVLEKIEAFKTQHEADVQEKDELENRIEGLDEQITPLAEQISTLLGNGRDALVRREGIDNADLAQKKRERVNLQTSLSKAGTKLDTEECNCTTAVDAFLARGKEMRVVTARVDAALADFLSADLAHTNNPTDPAALQRYLQTWETYVQIRSYPGTQQPAYDEAQKKADAACAKRDAARTAVSEAAAAVRRKDDEIRPVTEQLDQLDREIQSLFSDAEALHRQLEALHQQRHADEQRLTDLNRRIGGTELDDLRADMTKLNDRAKAMRCPGYY